MLSAFQQRYVPNLANNYGNHYRAKNRAKSRTPLQQIKL